jgi:cellulose synthase/poly-beta-1,6-N-acetylglucosamine synthase-like glycosyltransferase
VAGLIEYVLLPYVAGYYLFNLLMIAVGAWEIHRRRRVPPRLLAESARASGTFQPVSIVVPAFNEEVTICRTVESLLGVNYPEFEVIVINDGSEDRTLEQLSRAFRLERDHQVSTRALATQRVRGAFASACDPRLRVIDKVNGGKADALNAGLNQASFPLVLAVDADVVLDRDALAHLSVPFALHPETVAASGMIRLQNGCAIQEGTVVRSGMPRTLVEQIQVLEYIRSYGIGRMFFDRFNAHLIISGAFGLFSRRLLLNLGGYQPHAVGEDMELVVRAHRYLRRQGASYRIAFAPDAVCYTEAPHGLRELGRQRTRWHQGLLSTLRLHRSMCGRRRYGAAGLLAFPYFVAELFLPVVEALSWLVLPVVALVGAMDAMDVARYLLMIVLLGAALSLAAVAVDANAYGFFDRPVDRIRLAVAALVEPLGYRQCTVFFRLRAFARYYRTLQLRIAWRPPTRRQEAADGSPPIGAP